MVTRGRWERPPLRHSMRECEQPLRGTPAAGEQPVATVTRQGCRVCPVELFGETREDHLRLSIMQIAGIEIDVAVLDLVIADDDGRIASGEPVGEVPGGQPGLRRIDDEAQAVER